MKTEKITKVVISNDDLVNAITNELLRKGLVPKNPIEIRIGSRLEGYGLSEYEVTFIDDTTIECVERDG